MQILVLLVALIVFTFADLSTSQVIITGVVLILTQTRAMWFDTQYFKYFSHMAQMRRREVEALEKEKSSVRSIMD